MPDTQATAMTEANAEALETVAILQKKSMFLVASFLMYIVAITPQHYCDSYTYDTPVIPDSWSTSYCDYTNAHCSFCAFYDLYMCDPNQIIALDYPS
jgi:hypothetical protein